MSRRASTGTIIKASVAGTLSGLLLATLFVFALRRLPTPGEMNTEAEAFAEMDATIAAPVLPTAPAIARSDAQSALATW